MRRSTAFLDNEVSRLDAEYFAKSDLDVLARLRRRPHSRLSELAKITDGIHQSIEFSSDGPVRIFSAKHPKENYIASGEFETVSDKYHALNPRTALREGDVIISTVGTIGNAAVVTDEFLPANSDRHIGIVRLNVSVSPYFVSTALLSAVGRIQTNREATGNVQLNLFISKLNDLLIPKFCGDLEISIARLAEHAYRLRRLAQEGLEKVENSLNKALNLEPQEVSEEVSCQRTLQQVSSAERFDAEYFDPRKENMMRELLALPGRALSEYVISVKQILDPSKPADELRVRNYDLPDALVPILGVTKEMTSSLDLGSTKKIARDGDVVISRLRSYLREIAIVQADESVAAVVSTEFIVLRFRQGMAFPQEALWTFLRSGTVQTILRYCVDGSQHPRFSELDLLRIPVPDVIFESAPEIAVRFQMATSARERAAALLERAKRAVDVAIEESEEAALAFLRSFGG